MGSGGIVSSVVKDVRTQNMRSEAIASAKAKSASNQKKKPVASAAKVSPLKKLTSDPSGISRVGKSVLG